MIKCLKCGAEMDANSVFCGVCGARLKPDLTVIDGKKRKLSRRFVFQSGNSLGRTILFLAAFLLLFSIGVVLLVDGIPSFFRAMEKVPNAFQQIGLKEKYLAEGVPLSYIGKEISLLLTALLLLVDILFGIFIVLHSGYFAYFFGHHLYLHIRYKAYYPYHKPISMEKLSHLILSVSRIIFLVFLGIYLVLGLLMLVF